jgi:ferric-dicitrate binding protein FerR (iron transport regulator)
MNTDKEDLEFERKIREMKIPLQNFISEEEKETSWKEILFAVEKVPARRLVIRPVQWMAAATVLIVAGIAISIWLNSDNSFRTNDHEKLNVSLSDGSTVTLNYKSTLKLSDNFGEENRKVVLQGEAFFNIHKDESHPFVIAVGKTEVVVVGTSFNVNCRNNQVDVSVRTGKVRLQAGGKVLNLGAGEAGRISTAGDLSVSDWDANDFSWYSGTLTLKDKSLKEVAAILSKLFRRKVEVAPAVSSCTLSAKISYETIEDILNILKETLTIEWRNNSDIIYIDGKGC